MRSSRGVSPHFPAATASTETTSRVSMPKRRVFASHTTAYSERKKSEAFTNAAEPRPAFRISSRQITE